MTADVPPPTQVLTLYTPSPDEDATFLQRILSANNNKTAVVVNRSLPQATVLTWADMTVVFLLAPRSSAIPSDSSSSSVQVAVAVQPIESSWFQAAAKVAAETTTTPAASAATRRLVHESKIGDMRMCDIRLPGCAIWLIPPQLLTSAAGRMNLAMRLQTNGCIRNEKDVLEGFEYIDLSPVSVLEESASPENDSSNGDTRARQLGASSDSQPPACGIKIPSIKVKLLEQQGQWNSDFPINSQIPVPFETDLFKGEVLVLIRPPNPAEDDPYWNERVFSKKKRRIIVQIQGKFKTQPTGILYAGGEISKPMRLGLVTRGLAGILLKFVDSFTSNGHFSFGDDDEKACIVVPAYTFFERLVVTPPGETPPPLHTDFDESPESMALRKKSPDFTAWNTIDTYSFSYYTMFFDLPTWRIVGLPISGDIALRTFWGDSLFTICMYEKVGNAKKHLHECKTYAVAVQVEYLGKKALQEENLGDENEAADIMRLTSDRPKSIVRQETAATRNGMFRVESSVSLVDDDDGQEESYYFDAEESTNWEIDRLDVSTSGGSDRVSEAVERDLLRSIDDACPAWIEVCSSRSSYNKAFAIIRDGKLTLRPADDCVDLVQDSKWVNRTISACFSSRLSSNERTRRALGLIFGSEKHATDISPTKVQSFLFKENEWSESFLRRPEPSLANWDRASIRASSFVARAISDRHWIEEWAKVTTRKISFYHPDKRSSHYHIPLASVSDVSRLAPVECPSIVNHHFLALSTSGRTVYLMFADGRKRDEWLNSVRELMELVQMDNNSVSSSETNASFGQTSNPAEEFMHKSSMWSCKNRRILNCARFSLRDGGSEGKNDPLELVETALRLALKVSDESSTTDATLHREFLVHAALLKDACVHGLPEDKKVVFFVNLYHVMILHAYLVLGTPGSSVKWISYFNNVAYQVADDIFSLAELEHCIIRARMSYPSQFLSRFVIPKSWYRFALSRADYRLNFAMNCGSRANPESILIYRADDLQEQLDAASRLYLSNTCLVTRKSAGEVLVQLPRICQWFRDDFGGSDGDLLQRIDPHLPTKARNVLRTCWLPAERRFDMDCVNIRFLPFQYECRTLILYETDSEPH